MTVTRTPDALLDGGDASRPDRPRRVRRVRRVRRSAVLVGGVVLLVLLAVWILVFSPVFGVRSVVVRGTHTLSAATVERAAGISHGTPLLRVNTAAAVARLDRLAAVRSATVRTSWPGTVVIDVTERRPVGFLRENGHVVLVDTTGARFRTVQTPPARLPLLVLPSGADRATTAAVAAVAAALPGRILPRVASVQALDPQAITLLLRGDRVVHWGSAAQSRAKAQVLPPLLRRGATQIDVSDPAQPFTRD